METPHTKIEEKETMIWASDSSSLLNTIHEEKTNEYDYRAVVKQSNESFSNEFERVKDKRKNELSIPYLSDPNRDSHREQFTPQSYLFMNHSTEHMVLLLHAQNDFITFLNNLFTSFEYLYDIKPIQLSITCVTRSEWNIFSEDFTKAFGKNFAYSKRLSESPNDEIEIQSYISIISDYFNAYSQRNIASLRLKKKLSNEKKAADLSSVSHTVQEPCGTPLTTQSCKSTLIGNMRELEGYGYNYYYDLSNDWKAEANNVGVHMFILYDESQMITFVVRGDSCKWVPSLIEGFSGFTIIKEYKCMIESVAQPFYSYFHIRSVFDLEDAKKKIDSYEILNDLQNTRNENPIEKDIHNYLLSNYCISGNPHKIMKACVLQDRIETALCSTPLGNTPMIQDAVADTLKFRKTMSAILLNMGLKKKRMKDGIYYYGIEPNDTHEKIMTTELDVLIRVRDLQSKTGTKKDLSAFQISGIGLNSVDTCLKLFSTPLHST